MGTNSGATGEKEGRFGMGMGMGMGYLIPQHWIFDRFVLFIRHWQGHLVHSPACIVGWLSSIGFVSFIALLRGLYIKKDSVFFLRERPGYRNPGTVELFRTFGET